MEKKRRFSFSNFNDNMYALTGIAILAALILTNISLLKLCSQACAQGHNYLLFGMHFEIVGLVFFMILGFLHIFQKKYEYLSAIESLLFATALGSELMFIIVQKYYIGTWCPVCLAIAGCVALGVCSFAGISIKNNNKGEIMKLFKTGLNNIAAITFGFFIAFVGVTKYDAMEAAQTTVQENLAFGNKKSNIEVYLFTDWECPACRKLEPNLESIGNAITDQAKLIFVDEVVHPETLNFIPFNLAFILHNKKQYFQLRNMLTDLAKKTKTPTEKEVTEGAAKLGAEFIEPHYSDVALAVEYYKQLGIKYEIKSTPTMVLINTSTKKGKKLVGDSEITKENVLKAIETLKAI